MKTQNICYSDLHVHTNRSFCAPKETMPESYLPYLQQENIKILGLLNHLYTDKVIKERNLGNSGIEYTLGLKEEVEKIRSKTDTKILIGCEAEFIYKKSPSLKREDANVYDYLLLAPSHVMNVPHLYQHMDISTKEKLKEIYLENFKIACRTEYDIPTGICHPLYPISSQWEQEIVDEFTDDQLEECFKLAAKHEKSIEIHACIYRDGTKVDEEGISPSYMRMLKIAKDCGCYFHFGSDAHDPSEFIHVHALFEKAAKRLGLTEKNLWNIIN